ncbi:Polynucleotide 5'-hydroxyl-kinase grc3 [Sporothrix stenoceras]|uniref:Polynucleotide 5'-hydroxyl-kinase GRC3 n=1 Tax=Sporothrix stenoceras TaxID=5173 RepID=A0ABR3ZG73_9PEZI
MEPRKKRKVEPGPPPAPPKSARQRMLEQKEAAAREAQAALEKAAAEAKAEQSQADETQDAQPAVTEAVAVLPVQVSVENEAPKIQAEVTVAAAPVAAPELKPVEPPVVQIKSNATRLVIIGSYGLTIKCGTMTVAGATLRASEKTYWVHAPRCYALPVLRCTDDATIMLQPHPAAAALRQLGKLSPMFSRLWNEPPIDSSKKEFNATFQILYTSDDDVLPSRDITAPPEWYKLIAELTSPKKGAPKPGQQVLFVCGPKSSGKSTFSRLLANRLITKEVVSAGKQTKKWTTPSVAVLDIDPGQPEFGTPGSLSLVHVHEPNFQPPFCHPYVASDNSQGNKLLRAHELASVSPATDPEHYIECVLDLYSLYHRDLRNRCPLVVNTPGWIQGTGLEILTELLKRMRPSHVIYMSREGPDDTVVGLKSAYQNVPFVELPSQPGDLKVRTPAQLRTIQTMSYIHLDASSPPSKATSLQKPPIRPYASWLASPVSAIRPWVVPYTGPNSGILGVMCYDSQPPTDLVADTINGTMVSIVVIENMTAFRTMDEATDGSSTEMEVDAEDGDGTSNSTPRRLPPFVRSPEGIPYILNPDDRKLDPRHSYKLGVALVRGIDTRNKELHLLTPLRAGEAIDQVMQQDGVGVVLVSGKFDSPTWAYTEDMFLQSARKETKGAGEATDDVSGEDSDGDESDAGEDGTDTESAAIERGKQPPSDIPWVETLHGGQKRDIGSRVWRVRRDLGRNNNSNGGGD